jgi:colanic acid biosynthesis protein WcaH
MTIREAVSFLDKSIPDKTAGLPEDIFLFISRTTPLVNVDLLIKDKHGRVLLAWRDDEYYGKGWYIPGRIVRFKESLEDAVQKCAEIELGTKVEFDPKPVTVEQFIMPEWDIRAHFISFLYACSIPETYMPKSMEKGSHRAGDLCWHTTLPENFIHYHDRYIKYMF